MWQIELCVQLKTYDLSALTAKQTFWEMGYKELIDILRQDYYLFNLSCQTKEEAEDIVRNLAEKTPLFVNPNKHTYYIKNRKSEIGTRKFEEVLVWYREEGRKKVLLDSLKSFGYSVEDLLCGVLWQITVAEDKESRIVLVQKMVKELLMNPHSEDYKIL
jgi:phosphoribosylformylglycinamidine (FGAM) synthase PurS component